MVGEGHLNSDFWGVDGCRSVSKTASEQVFLCLLVLARVAYFYRVSTRPVEVSVEVCGEVATYRRSAFGNELSVDEFAVGAVDPQAAT